MRSFFKLCSERAGLLGFALSIAWLSAQSAGDPNPDCPADPDCPAKLQLPEPAEGDLFGCAVSLSENLLVVGSLFDDASGSASVFRRTDDGWQDAELLRRPAVSAGAQFGFSVAISGQDVIVGAPFDDAGGTDSGSAFIFQCSDESSCDEPSCDKSPITLLGHQASAFGRFGISVSIDEGTAVVGAPGAGGSGTVEIFQRVDGAQRVDDVWDYQTTIKPPGDAKGDAFGFSVSIHGDTLVVGAPYNDDAGDSSGAAYVVQRNANGTWPEQAPPPLTVPGHGAGDHLGFSVAMGNGTMVVGAPKQGKGAAYVFTGSGNDWSPGRPLPVTGVTGSGQFGVSVAIDTENDRVLVGARFDNDSGTAHVFQRGKKGWSRSARLLDEDGQPGDELGLGAAIAGDVAVAGAYKSDGNSGAAQVFLINKAGQFACADLSLSKEGPTTVFAGDPITYTFTVTNIGPSKAVNVSLEDSTLDVLTLDDDDPSCVKGVTCILPDIPPDGLPKTFDVTFQTSPDSAGTKITNVAYVVSSIPDPRKSDNTSNTVETDLVGRADLAIAVVDDPDPVVAGEPVTYTLTITNSGPSTARRVMIGNPNPPGSLVLVSAPDSCDGFPCMLAENLSPDSPPIVVKATFETSSDSAGSTIENTFRVWANTDDPKLGNNIGLAETTVTGEADLALDMLTAAPVDLGDAPLVVAGRKVEFTLTVTNSGPFTATGVLLEAHSLDGTPPPRADLTDCTATPPCNMTGFRCRMPNIPPNAPPVVVRAICDVDPALVIPASPIGGSTPTLPITITASVSSAGRDPDRDNNTRFATFEVKHEVNLTVVIDDGQETAFPGTLLRQEYAISNDGPSSLVDGILQIIASTTDEPDVVVREMPLNLGPGDDMCPDNDDMCLDYIEGFVPAGTLGELIVTANVTDPQTRRTVIASDRTVILPAPVGTKGAFLAGTMTVSGSFIPGSTVTYRILLLNGGPGDQPENADPELRVEMIPPVLELLEATGGASILDGENTVQWNGSIAAPPPPGEDQPPPPSEDQPGGYVEIMFTARLAADLQDEVCIQGDIFYDEDGTGENTGMARTSVTGPGPEMEGPTCFTPRSAAEIPAVSPVGLGLLVLALAVAGVRLTRRGRKPGGRRI